MIKNERQYRITKAQADRFSQTLRSLRRRSGGAEGVHPVIAKAQEDALRSQIADLKDEMREYESLKAGEAQLDGLNLVTDLSVLLIRARISQGLSQRELAERIGVKEQQVQRYEATDYASASLSRIREVADALGASDARGADC